jgi:hypothetical protein
MSSCPAAARCGNSGTTGCGAAVMPSGRPTTRDSVVPNASSCRVRPFPSPSRPEGVPVWSLDGIVCIGEMLKNAVRLTFPKGAQMKDPKKLFNARLNSSSVRAIDFYEGEKVPEAALTAVILEAVGLNV